MLLRGGVWLRLTNLCNKISCKRTNNTKTCHRWNVCFGTIGEFVWKGREVERKQLPANQLTNQSTPWEKWCVLLLDNKKHERFYLNNVRTSSAVSWLSCLVFPEKSQFTSLFKSSLEAIFESRKLIACTCWESSGVFERFHTACTFDPVGRSNSLEKGVVGFDLIVCYQ